MFIEQLKDLRDVVEKKIVLSNPDPLRTSQKNRSYDQVVKGNVKIIKIVNVLFISICSPNKGYFF